MRYNSVTNGSSEPNHDNMMSFTVMRLHGVLGSWRSVGRVMGYSGGYAKLVADGERNPSPRAVAAIHEYMTGDPPPVMVETPACPDCGSVHNGGRCNGKPVTVRLVRQRTPPPAWVREATRNLEALRGKE